MGYVDELPVSEEIRNVLRSLGADTPESLLGLIHASPEAFERMVGSTALERIRSSLRQMLPEHVRKLVETTAPAYGLGAELQRSPALPNPDYDLEKRDRLFGELQRLRSDPATRNGPRAEQLERELNAMLEDRFR